MTPTDPEAVKVIFRVLQVFDRIGVPYHLGGSYASAIHGVPRQTHDVDLVVDLRRDRVSELVRSLAGEFYVDEEEVERAVAARGSCNLVHLASGVKVDLFVKGASAFDDAEFERRVPVLLGEETPREVFVKSAEDTLLRKLLWYRLGGEVSDRQWEDVRGILSVQADRLDVEYLCGWADRLSIRDLLDRLLVEG
ncbi:MAG: nucleotidyltransferase domain-containing protein [Acidobacteriota bacterium]